MTPERAAGWVIDFLPAAIGRLIRLVRDASRLGLNTGVEPVDPVTDDRPVAGVGARALALLGCDCGMRHRAVAAHLLRHKIVQK